MSYLIVLSLYIKTSIKINENLNTRVKTVLSVDSRGGSKKVRPPDESTDETACKEEF